MESIHFEVSAKATRLIGRENISSVDGAIIELIKNAYDADAERVYVVFEMPFPYVPSSLSSVIINNLLSESDRDRIVKEFYIQRDNGEYIKKDLDINQTDELKRILMHYNTIIVADNGIGMSENDVKTKWMYIATSDKEANPSSKKGRIKTGAKGIGRFALDKLSLETEMYTQTKDSDLVHWQINWEQFSNIKNLGQISAVLNTSHEKYSSIVFKRIEKYINDIAEKDDSDWSQGTMLVMHPIREEWSERTFEKVNQGLRSINPMGDADPFKVYVRNSFSGEYNYDPSETAVSEDDYDYKISIEFDGDNTLHTSLHRNEVDLSVNRINIKEIEKEVGIDTFWERPFFKTSNHKKTDYNSTVDYYVNVSDILRDDLSKIKSVGPFSGELYFIKSEKSPFEIIKPIKRRKRKALLDSFSGIKIYRDHFKVRPYGDDGELYDWLGLQRRQNKSPGGVADKGPSWKVLTYQLIGQIQIGRFRNYELKDTANREGLEQNDQYRIFKDMILNSISHFEIDRGLFYKEFTDWYKSKKDELSPSQRIISEAINAKEGGRNDYSKGEKQEDFKADYQEAIYDLVVKNRKEIEKNQILQMLASSSLILSTFFHEYKEMQLHFEAIPPQLRKRADSIITQTGYKTSLIDDPFILIDDLEKQNKMLSIWLKLALERVKRNHIKSYVHSLRDTILKITEQWTSILSYYNIELKFDSEEEKNYDLFFSDVDLYIIVNNYILNSVYFLQTARNEHRMISISLREENDFFSMQLKNNGPSLDKKYSGFPEKIFELGETSKEEEGTGLGLWIMKETIERYNGSVVYESSEEGFIINAYFRKQGDSVL